MVVPNRGHAPPLNEPALEALTSFLGLETPLGCSRLESELHGNLSGTALNILLKEKKKLLAEHPGVPGSASLTDARASLDDAVAVCVT